MIKKNSKEKLFETMARLDKTFKPKLNEVLVGSESSSSLLLDSPVIKNPLDKAGLGNEVSAFDIAEAIAVYVYNYNEDIPTIHELRSILTKLRFKPSPMFSYNENDLEDGGKLVYDALVNYYENSNEPVQETTDQILPEAKKYEINPKYTHFAAMKDGSGIINGWDYTGYDQSELSLEKKHYFFNDIAEIDVDPKLVAVYTRKKIEKMGINPFDKMKWKNAGTKDLDETWTDGTNYNPNDNAPSPLEYFIDSLPDVKNIAIKFSGSPMRWGGYLAKDVNFKNSDNDNGYFYINTMSDSGRDEQGERTYGNPPKGNVLVVPLDIIVDLDASSGSYGATLVIDDRRKNKIRLISDYSGLPGHGNTKTSDNVFEGNGQVAYDMQMQAYGDGKKAYAPSDVNRDMVKKFESFYSSLTPEEKQEFTRLRIGPIQKQEPEMGGGADGIVDYDR